MADTPHGSQAPANWGRGRALLLDSARELFTERGFSAVSTREIATRAGVTEPMIFRHFGSKAGLFRHAVLEPLVEHLGAYVTEWEHRPHHVRDALDEARDFYRGIYEVFAQNRHLIKAMVEVEAASGPGGSPTPSAAIAELLSPVFRRFAEVLQAEQRARGFRQFDPIVQARLMLGLAMSQAAFGDWLPLPADAGERFTVDDLVREMALFTVYGAWDPPATM